MDYVSVSSTSVAAIGYESETNTLGVRFQNGGEYHYFGVPEDVFEALKSASSIGSYINEYIKKAGYPCSKVG
jgi:KTSC domain